MSIDATVTEPAHAGGPPAVGRSGPLMYAAALLLVVAGAALAWRGGVVGAAGALLATLASTVAMSRKPSGEPSSSRRRAAPPEAEATGGRGAELMVRGVAPVWSRQILATRDTADRGLSQLLEAFSGLSGAIDTLAGQLSANAAAVAPGAVDEALGAQPPALEALMAPSARAFSERDAAFAEIGRCLEALADLQEHAKRAREVGRHTRLVAFNATIESQRQSGSGAGAHGGQAVAAEVRVLADRMAEIAEQIDRRVAALRESLAPLRRKGQLADTTEDELRLELQLRAREALQAMTAQLGAAVQGSASVRQASDELRRQIDAAFVNFQFGDRVSQMLAIVAQDIDQLVRWVAEHPLATQDDVGAWLAALEKSYTTDEQRSEHHGNVHVDRGSSVDFF